MLQGCKIFDPLSISKVYTFFKRQYAKGYFFRGESHDFHEVVCVLSGSVGITSDNKIFTLKSGEMTYHPPGEFHAIWNDGESEAEAIIFSFSTLSMPAVNGKVFSLGEDDIAELLSIWSLITESFPPKITNVLQGREISAAIAVKKIEIFLLRQFSKCAILSFEQTPQSTLFSNILAVMNQHLSSSITITEMANLCGISVPTLEKTVNKYLGYGAMAHYNSLKMLRAHTMLYEGASVKECAFSLGYTNQNYFSARFKKHYGYSPSKVHSKKIL